MANEQALETSEVVTSNAVPSDASNGNAAKPSLSDKVREVDEMNGYVTSKRAAQFLSTQSGKNIPITTVNNLAYADKVECVKIGGIFLFLLVGEKSLTAYVPSLHAADEKRNEKAKQEEQKKARKAIQAKFDELVNAAINSGTMPDMNAIREKLGI